MKRQNAIVRTHLEKMEQEGKTDVSPYDFPNPYRFASMPQGWIRDDNDRLESCEKLRLLDLVPEVVVVAGGRHVIVTDDGGYNMGPLSHHPIGADLQSAGIFGNTKFCQKFGGGC